MPLVDDLATAVAVELKSALRGVDERLAIARADAARLAAELVQTRERLAAIEARPPAPGPPGADGAPGQDGAPGAKGDPGLVYRGVYQATTAYRLGDVVTWAGGAWHCNTATTRKPGDGPDWTLMVKSGKGAR